ncbi:hypothetical protein BD289DRAFT_484336 [Coniella lustricola]|uniref:Zinc finger PHD-type domain-containing protein n=1 Tax=Coniella lustricola TaxID=2025994 RepID=A0A2T3A2G4_9PEZI|nr:hypothetical protein BD289DRAFT_484336 [Coniella lustricola]
MPSRKRTLQEAESAPTEQLKPDSLILRLRNCFHFANLYQWICIFGKVVKIDDNLDIEDLETECLKHGSMALQDIGLALLKHISSHRGLTHEIFDEYTRRQFDAKLPHKKNPFGKGEVVTKFAEFDLFKKLRVLWQMTQIVMMKPEHIRPNMDEQKNDEQTAWRIEPYGWDRKDREYYVLDDNRLYRLTTAPPPATPTKKTSQKAKAAARAAKRRRLAAAAAAAAAESNNDESDNASAAEDNNEGPDQDDEQDALGGAIWECIAITLDEVRDFIEPLLKTKDPNEKILRGQIEEHMLPLLEKQEESKKRKIQQRERELLNLEKLAHAKRSSRIAGKAEQQKQEETERQEREKRRVEEVAAKKEEQKRMRLEKERDNRMKSRDQRLREREARRIQHEDELAQLSEGSKGPEAARLSERRLQAEIEKNKQALRELDDEEEDWIFDCVCGLHGQVDDGQHSVACERCNVWQHSKCLGIKEEEAERDDFHLICQHCQRTERERKEKQHQKPPPKIKIKRKEPVAASSVPTNKPVSTTPIPLPSIPGMANFAGRALLQTKPAPLNGISLPSPSASASNKLPKPSPQKHSSPPAEGSYSIAAPLTYDPLLPSAPLSKPTSNGLSHNPFSSPHPSLLPPDQSPNKSRAYGSIYTSSSPIARDSVDVLKDANDRPPSSSATAHATLPGHKSPSREPATKDTTGVASPQKSANTPVSSAKVLDQRTSSPVSMATPRLSPSRLEDGEPLPSSRGGLSPTKISPSYTRPASHGHGTREGQNGIHSSPTPAILPPVTALSPSPQKPNPTPPVKVDEPPRPGIPYNTKVHSSPVQP